jgi:RNA polymerase sigma factor (sigma-70 family)
MQLKSDAQLLREYADSGAETAFGELVQRHTNLVYSAVLRQVESPAVAAEISQNIFLDLARRAEPISNRMSSEASLAGWLCRSARNLSLNFRRDEYRRRIRERRHLEENMSDSKTPPDWERLRGVLDEAMGELSETDYDAVVLRFYQDQDFRAVGAAMGMSDDAAQKRVTRALEKLRDSLARRGIRTTAAALSAALLANAVSSAPAGLAVGMAGVAAAEMLAATPVATMALKTFTMTTLQKALVTATVVVLAGVGIFEGVRAARAGAEVDRFRRQQARLEQQVKLLETARDGAAGQAALGRAGDQEQRRRLEHLELLSLRGRVNQLANQLSQQEAAGGLQAVTNTDAFDTNQDTVLLSSSGTNQVASGDTLVLGGWKVKGERKYLLVMPVIAAADGASAAGSPMIVHTQGVSAPDGFWDQIGWGNLKSSLHRSTVATILTADETASLLAALKATPGAEVNDAGGGPVSEGDILGEMWTVKDDFATGKILALNLDARIASGGQSVVIESQPVLNVPASEAHPMLQP